MGTKVKVSVTMNQARVALDRAIETYYRSRDAEEREEDERWADLGDDTLRKSSSR